MQGRFDFWRGFKPEFENKTHDTLLFNDEAVKVINRHNKEHGDTKPLFLYLAHTAPHDPLIAPKGFEEPCKHIINSRRRTYCSMVNALDAGVGRVVEALQSNGMLENTVIIFSSDNGGVPFTGGFNYPFRYMYSLLYCRINHYRI